VLNTHIVRQDNIAARRVTEDSDNAGLRPAQNTHDTPFGALRSGNAPAPQYFRDHVIAMHGIFDGMPRDEKVPVHFWDGRIGNHEAIAIVM
jgi:hypothetical protein